MNAESSAQASTLDLPSANFVNNEWRTEGSGASLTVTRKYTGEALAELPMAGPELMEEAIEGAVSAFAELKTWSAGRRSVMLAKLRDALAGRRQEFIDLIVAEAGKPVAYAANEIDRCLVTLDTAVREALTFTGELVPVDYHQGEGKTAFTRRFPIGPIVAISPFNFPLNLALHKIAPAFAVGCSVVLKPAPQAPLVALAFADLVREVGYPKGALNVLVCDIPVAQSLVTDPRMKMLSFTGSPSVGWHLKSIAGEKKVVLELGGNAAAIVDESAEVAETAQAIAIGAFLYAGQICISTQRIYVHAAIYEEFEKALLAAIKALKSGDPNDPHVINGPLIDAGHRNRIDLWIREAQHAGAVILSGGKALNESANVYAPTVLTNTRPGMKVVDEEVFGPVAILEKVDSFEEAIQRTNASRFGLQAGVFTNRLDQMKQAHEQLEVGGIMMNNVPGFRVDNMPYGGVKASGLGREGIRYSMEEMTEGRLLIY